MGPGLATPLLMNGDLPERLVDCTAVQLSSNAIMVISGVDNHANITKTVFMATLTPHVFVLYAVPLFEAT